MKDSDYESDTRHLANSSANPSTHSNSNNSSYVSGQNNDSTSNHSVSISNQVSGINSSNNNHHMSTLNRNGLYFNQASLERRASKLNRNTKKLMHKMNMGEATDDVHECVRCLRAIMNHQYGFHMVIAHIDAINSIALSLKHKEYR
jgi:hypothetical protein